MIRRLHLVLAAAAFAAVAFASSSAAAQDLLEIQTTGTASASDGDTRALDDAFSRAVEQGLAKLLQPEVLRQHADVLRREVIARPRRYVASYTVRGTDRAEGRIVSRVIVRVDLDKLGAALAARGIDLAAASTDTATGRAPLTVLLKATAADETVTTFGSTGSAGGPAGLAVAHELEARGFALVSAAGQQAPTVLSAGESAGELVPLDDGAGATLARELGAGGAVIVGVQALADGPIRGTRLVGSVAQTTVRVVDAATGALVARITTEGSGYGGDPSAAAAAAQKDAVAAAIAAVERSLVRYWPPTLTLGAETAVVIRGAATWSPIAAVIQRLGSTRGVDAVHAQRVSGDRVTLAVASSLRPEELVAAVRRARLARGTVDARVRQNGVEVVVTGDSEYSVLEP